MPSKKPISALGIHVGFATLAAPDTVTTIENVLSFPEINDAPELKKFQRLEDTREQTTDGTIKSTDGAIECDDLPAADCPGQIALQALKGQTIWIKIWDDEGDIETIWFQVHYSGRKKAQLTPDADRTVMYMISQLTSSTTVNPGA